MSMKKKNKTELWIACCAIALVYLAVFFL